MKKRIASTSVEIRNTIKDKLKTIIKSPCQRILLIHPQHISEDDFSIEKALRSRYWSYQPYGCGVLARDLEARGYQTDILDLNYEVLNFVHKARNNFYYSVWREKLEQRLENFKPDLVSISCMFTMSHASVKAIARAIKAYDPLLPVIGGGVHFSNAKKLVLEDCPDIDFVGIYECDKSFPDLVDFVNGKLTSDSLTQLATIVDGVFMAIEDRSTPTATEIDAAPSYHDLDIGNYNEVGQIGSYGFLRRGRKAVSILSNRGCRAHCSFCSVASFNGPGVRERSVSSVIDEIQELQEKYYIRHITWLDDDLLFNKQRAMALFNEITRRKLDITWDGSNGLIAAAIKPDIMQAMAESGCVGFNLGIESGSPEILRSVHKPGTVDSFRKAKTIIDQYPHIFIKGFLMLGFPNETLKQILDTVNLALELSFDWYSIQILNPLPSTEIYDEMVATGLIQDNLATSDVAYVFGPQNRQRLREEREKLSAADFFNLFNICDVNSVPDKKDLIDYWFLMDYKVNYEKILGINDPVKIKKISGMFEDVCSRIAPENPLAHLFYGVSEYKLGNTDIPKMCAEAAEQIIKASDYWQKRFEALDLYDLLDKVKSF